ncbi:MAG TPA: MoxR family ATPase [Bradyrhizobium sp.]|nr:MoxR family ATPase [Bradyrhizobium sp.]
MLQTHYQRPFSEFKHTMVGRDGKRYYADDGLLAAANVALALGRPLLLTGEPGCGKTDFAFAAASGLTPNPDKPGHALLQFYVRSDTTARDLLYRYDAVRRFSDAQTGGDKDRERAQLPQNYVALEALGTALISPHRRTVLVDEIDKAQRDLPNDLLRELDQARFEIPEIDLISDSLHARAEEEHQNLRRNMQAPTKERPLVIITSNVERQLPDAFLRRCVFYYVAFPANERLVEILNGRFGIENELLHKQAVSLFSHLRRVDALVKKPATAELVDWVQCLATVFDRSYFALNLEREAASAVRGANVDWSVLPGLACLLKLREDLELLHLRPA